MPDKTASLTGAAGLTLAAATGALAGWWWQSRSREPDLDERTRARLRAWGRG